MSGGPKKLTSRWLWLWRWYDAVITDTMSSTMNTSMTVAGGSPVLSPVSPRPVFLEPLPTSPMSSVPTTPRRSVTPQECPNAPARPTGGRRIDLDLDLDDVRPPPLQIPSVEDHRGKGILPEYFIKPEPGMPLWEKRKYVESELERWLTSPLFHQHVKDVAILDEAGQLVCETNWPAADVFLFHKSLAWDNDYAETCAEILERCLSYLRHGGFGQYTVNGLLETCTLSNGKTIRDYWDTSDLDELRDAPPLPDDEEEKEEIGDGIGFAFIVKGETIDLDFQVKIPLKAILTWLVLWVSWLMLNTYVLCKDGGC